MLNPHLKEFDVLMKKGIGLACIHYGVEVPKGAPGDYFLKWIGSYFETNWSVNPHWVADFKLFPGAPHCFRVTPFAIKDEWYYHMRFSGVDEWCNSYFNRLTPRDALRRKDGPHSNNPHVRASVLKKKEKSNMWFGLFKELGLQFWERALALEDIIT